MNDLKPLFLSIIVVCSIFVVGFSQPIPIKHNRNPKVSSPIHPDTILKIYGFSGFADGMALNCGSSVINTIFGIKFDFSIAKYLSVREQLRNEIKSKKIRKMEIWEEGYSDNQNNTRKGYPLFYAKFDTLGNLTEYFSGFGRELKWKVKYQLQYHSNGELKKVEKTEAPNHLVYFADYLNDSVCLSERWFEDGIKTILVTYEYDSAFNLIHKNSRYLYETFNNGYEIYTYNSEGRILSAEENLDSGENKKVKKWSYNNLGLVDSIVLKNRKGKMRAFELFFYSENHSLKRYSYSKYTRSHTNDIYYKYDSSDRKTEILKRWGDGHSKHYKWKYNEDNQISQFSYLENEAPQEIHSYYYGLSGQLVKKKEFVFEDGSGKPRQKLWQTTTYQYFANGEFSKIEVEFESWPGNVYDFYYEYYD